MKKYIFAIVLIFAANTLYSQFFMDWHYGYNYSNKQAVMPFENKYNLIDYTNPLDSTISYYTLSDTSYSYNYYKYDSVNKINSNIYRSNIIGISTGYKFNKFSVSLGFNYIFIKPNFISKRTYEEILPYVIYKENRMDSLKLDNYNLVMDFSYYYPIDKLELFVNAGINLYYTEIVHEYYSCVEYDEANSYNVYKNIEWKKKYWGYSCGFNAGIGVKYNFYKNISAFAKINYSLGNLNIRKGELVEYYNRDEEVTKEVPSDIEPHDIPFYKIPYSGFNTRIGLRYTFRDTGKNNNDND